MIARRPIKRLNAATASIRCSVLVSVAIAAGCAPAAKRDRQRPSGSPPADDATAERGEAAARRKRPHRETAPVKEQPPPAPARPRALSDLLAESGAARPPAAIAPAPKFDDARVRAAGIRKLVGQHITLYTDLPSTKAIDALPAVFDAAAPQWAAYFKIDRQELRDWRMQGYLIGDLEPFRGLHMLPRRREGLRNGYSVDHELWLVDQRTDYYRRHLLLHEGTHGFMNTLVGGCGPPWYMEGIAELLATHAWNGTEIELGIMPARREDVPGLGRIRLVQDAFRANRALRIGAILRTDNSRALENETYAWCWALAKFFDAHPRYRDRFRELVDLVTRDDFSQHFLKTFSDDWPSIEHEWQLFVGTLDHNHDLQRTAIDFVEGTPLAVEETRNVSISVERGWQSSGVHFERGMQYQIRAGGRFQIADQPEPWPCEANGVTIEYFQGRPLGVLLATILESAADAKARNESGPKDDAAESIESITPLLRPFVVGTEVVWRAKRSGTLYFKINESPGRLADNSGALAVSIAALKDD